MTTKRYALGQRPRITKTFDAKFSLTGKNSVTALVSVFGNIDFVGDRVVAGAFAKSLDRWKASGDGIPVLFAHRWDDPWSHIGIADPMDVKETPTGLQATYSLDVEHNPVAAQVHRLLKQRRMKEHSFAYDVARERTAEDGANELLELDLLELGPTLKGANPDTELLDVKSLFALDDRPRDRFLKTHPGDDGRDGHTDPEIARLKRQLDRLEYGALFRHDIVDRFIEADRIERRLEFIEEMSER